MKNSCQVTFYVLASEAQSARQIACRLSMKAWEQGNRVLVLAADENEATSLDEEMWEIPAGRFLPHARGPVGTNAPVGIEIHGAGIPDDCDVVINLADQAVADPGSCKRLLEIVPCADRQRLASREKFRIYRDLGLEPETLKIN